MNFFLDTYDGLVHGGRGGGGGGRELVKSTKIIKKKEKKHDLILYIRGASPRLALFQRWVENKKFLSSILC